MDTNDHDIKTLFAQLGLDDDPQSIAQFLKTHRLPEGVAIKDADFWTPAQAQFICEALKCDAAWAIVVDELATLLTK